ncbi:hypothetical protein HPT27_10460 [Permianibacter sp. IMCC34836]|uniref:hypothetical protein n=1 Tax=Permianibacter fluminis TaxID=2738515 RepID=UPI001551E7C6|nr:hypothetical protein [Permianibacter fluminis]NQD37450.1 hypothetical protein [Permianibacter fluminis]
MTRLLSRIKHWRISRSARAACRRADFVIRAVHDGMPVSTAVERSKSLLFSTLD